MPVVYRVLHIKARLDNQNTKTGHEEAVHKKCENDKYLQAD